MIHTGDCLTVLRGIADSSVQCCVTSPPYYGLRSYCDAGSAEKAHELGLEKTPQEYVDKMVAVFREVRRVLRDDGVMFLNIGDSYNGIAPNTTGQNGYGDGRANRDKRYSTGGIEGLKPKDLIGIPWMLAFALRNDGWYLRQDIIWHKPNPMPESVTDRCTKAHEYIFLLTKSSRYYYDAEAVKEESVDPIGSEERYKNSFSGNNYMIDRKTTGQPQGVKKFDGKRNRRSVWTVTTKPFRGAHFATFPLDLITPCIKAGSAKGSTVLDPFNGAGTTGVACKLLGREYIGIELNPAYVAMAEKRIAETTVQGELL